MDSRLKLSKQERMAVAGTLLFGFMAQGMGLCNKYAFSDSLNHMFDIGVTIPSGRGGLYLLSKLETLLFGEGSFALPLYNGMVALLAIALSVVILIRMFRFQNPILCALLGGLWAAFPSLTALMYFDFTVHLYMIGLVMGTVGCYLALESKRYYHVAVGIILIGFAIGVYQAFLPMFATIIVIHFVRELCIEYENNTSMLRALLKRIVIMIGSMMVYFGLNEVLKRLTHESYTGYMGIGSELEVPLRSYIMRAAVAVREFYYPSSGMVDSIVYVGNTRYLYLIFVFAFIIMAVMLVRKTWSRLSTSARAVLVLTLLFVPVTVNMIYILSGYRILRMEYSMVSFYFVIIFLVEMLCDETNTDLKSVKLLTLATLLMCLSLIRVDNISYLKTSFVQTEAISYFNTLVTSIKNVEGYRDEYPVLFLNQGNIADTTIKQFDEFNGIPEDPNREMKDYLNDFMWQEFMGTWCGFDPVLASESDIKDVKSVADMPAYPDKGSIQVIDDVIVVKF